MVMLYIAVLYGVVFNHVGHCIGPLFVSDRIENGSKAPDSTTSFLIDYLDVVNTSDGLDTRYIYIFSCARQIMFDHFRCTRAQLSPRPFTACVTGEGLLSPSASCLCSGRDNITFLSPDDWHDRLIYQNLPRFARANE